MNTQIDTSGEVDPPPSLRSKIGGVVWRWEDLTPFEQGYTLAALGAIQWPDPPAGYAPSGPPRFIWLAPETLETIRADCARFTALHSGAADGGRFWRARQKGLFNYENFPPLTLRLYTDGRVRF